MDNTWTFHGVLRQGFHRIDLQQRAPSRLDLSNGTGLGAWSPSPVSPTTTSIGVSQCQRRRRIDLFAQCGGDDVWLTVQLTGGLAGWTPFP